MGEENGLKIIVWKITKVVGVTEHSREADVDKVQVAKVKEYMKKQATVNWSTPGQLIIDSTVNTIICVCEAMGWSRSRQADYPSSEDQTPSHKSPYRAGHPWWMEDHWWW